MIMPGMIGDKQRFASVLSKVAFGLAPPSSDKQFLGSIPLAVKPSTAKAVAFTMARRRLSQFWNTSTFQEPA
jgi:hypothetical protein